MSKAETIIQCVNVVLAGGLIFIPVFTGLLKLSKVPLWDAFCITTSAYATACLVLFVTLQFLIQ